MKAFGIEIRKADQITDLYRQVDRTLSTVPQGGINKELQRDGVAHALQRMLRVERHFSVCTIRDCAELAQIPIAEERMRLYRAAHCVDWGEMTPEYRQQIVALVLDDFRSILNPTEDAVIITQENG